jgi:hypothetical protein
VKPSPSPLLLSLLTLIRNQFKYLRAAPNNNMAKASSSSTPILKHSHVALPTEDDYEVVVNLYQEGDRKKKADGRQSSSHLPTPPMMTMSSLESDRFDLNEDSSLWKSLMMTCCGCFKRTDTGENQVIRL